MASITPVYRSAQITRDPATHPSPGDSLVFQGTRAATILEVGTSGRLDHLHAGTGTILTLQFADDERHDVDGTAVMVGPGVAFAARHVIEPHLDRLQRGNAHAMCTAPTNVGLNIWTVRALTLPPGLDVALLGLELSSALPSDRTFRQAMLSTRLPPLGEPVQIVGFRAANATRALDGLTQYGVEAMLLASVGVVTQHFLDGRDSAMLPGPVLEVDCPAWGGMSGGPVYDINGDLIGVLSTSLSDVDNRGPSYVSLLFPALVAPFKGGWPAAAFQGNHRLLDFPNGTCWIEGRDALQKFVADDGAVTFAYTPWS